MHIKRLPLNRFASTQDRSLGIGFIRLQIFGLSCALGLIAHTHATEPPNASPEAALLADILKAEFKYKRLGAKQSTDDFLNIALNSSDADLFSRALVRTIEAGDTNATLTIATRWATLEPNNISAQFFLAHLALKAKAFPLATESLQHILRLDKNARLDRLLSGVNPTSEAEREDILTALKPLIKHNNASLLLITAKLSSQQGKLSEALYYVDNAIKQKPRQLNLYQFKAGLYDAKHQHLKQQFLAQSVRISPEIALWACQTLQSAHNAQHSAEYCYSKALQYFPSSYTIRYATALYFMQNKQYAAAKAHLQHITNGLATPPIHKDHAQLLLAKITFAEKQFTTAEKQLLRIKSPELINETLSLLISTKIAQGQGEDALLYINELLTEELPDPIYFYNLKAKILHQLHRQDEAYQTLEGAIQEFPDDLDLKLSLLELTPVNNHFQRAQVYALLLEKDPSNSAWRTSYTMHLLQAGLYLDANKSASQALNIDPTNAIMLMAKALSENLLKQPKRALTTLEQFKPENNDPSIESALLLTRTITYYFLKNEKQYAKNTLKLMPTYSDTLLSKLLAPNTSTELPINWINVWASLLNIPSAPASATTPTEANTEAP